MTYGIVKRKNWRQTRKDFRYNENRYFPVIEKMFWLYPKIKLEVEDIRGEQGYYQSGYKEGGGSSNHAFISDPTAQQAMKHLKKIKVVIVNSGKISEDKIENPEDWLVVVEQTLEFFSKEPFIKDILTRRYLKNEPMATTCIDLNIEPNQYGQYYKARNAGIRYARECAIQLGLIKVF